jgi:hypothetical protein
MWCRVSRRAFMQLLFRRFSSVSGRRRGRSALVLELGFWGTFESLCGRGGRREVGEEFLAWARGREGKVDIERIAQGSA